MKNLHKDYLHIPIKSFLKALASFRKCPYDELFFEKDINLTKDESLFLKKVALRLAAEEPLTKILQESNFYGRSFYINEHVLDPRPDTECLIDAVLKIKEPFSRFLDLGTGSGCILITLLLAFPHATGVAVDLSAEALDVAKKNAKHFNVSDRITFIKSDWFLNVPQEYFDCIVSNPPYISKDYVLDQNVVQYDPHLALFSGIDGLDAFKIILKDIQSYLKNDGYFVAEMGFDQAELLSIEIEKFPNLKLIEIIKDLSHNDRVIVVKKSS